MSDELKPGLCPYCGKDKVEVLQTGPKKAKLWCKAGCFMYEQRSLNYTIELIMQKMIEKFNTRPIEDELRARLERRTEDIKLVEAELDRLKDAQRWVDDRLPDEHGEYWCECMHTLDGDSVFYDKVMFSGSFPINVRRWTTLPAPPVTE